MKVGKCCVHDINTIDKKTKFVVEEELMNHRSKKRIDHYFKRIKDRYKTPRHGGGFSSAKKVLKMRQIIHNFVNPHQELGGKTPAEAAEIKYNLGKNKLLKLVELTAKLKNFGDDDN